MFFNHFRSSYYCFVPTSNCNLSAKFVTTCKYHLWISWTYSVLLLLLNTIRTNFSLCSIPLIKTCSLLLFITLTSENIGLNWYSTSQCGSWRVSQPLKSSSFYLFFIFCFRSFKSRSHHSVHAQANLSWFWRVRFFREISIKYFTIILVVHLLLYPSFSPFETLSSKARCFWLTRMICVIPHAASFPRFCLSPWYGDSCFLFSIHLLWYYSVDKKNTSVD